MIADDITIDILKWGCSAEYIDPAIRDVSPGTGRPRLSIITKIVMAIYPYLLIRWVITINIKIILIKWVRQDSNL